MFNIPREGGVKKEWVRRLEGLDLKVLPEGIKGVRFIKPYFIEYQRAA